ncbi:hypothetical protein GUJ93_ZPchr0010g8548 [Zizania palustris]|uniref:Uncharacterized protein n=1 Tax=Zizania palustris TaxID=103762 RepID=A0A8J5TMA9_ZIZPA|nr:hypothetical protein GUJ93_ZPchr0010g8548 [Zizania palustris]
MAALSVSVVEIVMVDVPDIYTPTTGVLVVRSAMETNTTISVATTPATEVVEPISAATTVTSPPILGDPTAACPMLLATVVPMVPPSLGSGIKVLSTNKSGSDGGSGNTSSNDDGVIIPPSTSLTSDVFESAQLL